MKIEKDFARLRQLDEEVDRLIAIGKWNEIAFRRIFPIALKAAAGDGDSLEFLYMAARPEWRKRLNADYTKKKEKAAV